MVCARGSVTWWMKIYGRFLEMPKKPFEGYILHVGAYVRESWIFFSNIKSGTFREKSTWSILKWKKDRKWIYSILGHFKKKCIWGIPTCFLGYLKEAPVLRPMKDVLSRGTKKYNAIFKSNDGVSRSALESASNCSDSLFGRTLQLQNDWFLNYFFNTLFSVDVWRCPWPSYPVQSAWSTRKSRPS